MPAHRVIIVGGGFGGLHAARRLCGESVAVTLVDRRNFHLFQPLLYQVATGGLSPGDIASPLRAVLKRCRNVRVLEAEVQDVDPVARRVVLDDGELPYDSLIVAAGAAQHYFGRDAWANHAPGLKTIEDATAMRARILGAFEAAERAQDEDERKAMLAFVVVGGGPTGVELAGAIGELARETLRRDFRSFDPASARILLIEGGPKVLSSYPEALGAAACRSLARLGVEVVTGTMVEAIDAEGVTLRGPQGTERIQARTVLWAAGVRAAELAGRLADRTGAAVDAVGRLVVGADLALAAYPEIAVIGDMAAVTGPGGRPLPGVAPVAMQQGRYAARRLLDRLDGRATPAFRYRDRGNLAVIGRAAAVADLGRLRFSGYPAWLLWLFIHIMYLVEFENRLLVFVQWALSYFTRNRGARLITRDRA